MVQCFDAECNHQSLRESCTFFRWPTNEAQLSRWRIVSVRRADRMPTWNSRLCSCHFVDGRKENGPTIFKVNKYKGTKIKDPKRCLPWRGKRLADVVPALDDTIHDISSFVSDSLPSMTLTSLHYYLNHKANSTVPSVTPTSMTLTSMTLPSPHRLSRMVNTSMMGENKLLPVTVADTEDMKQQEGTTLTIRYLTGSDSSKMDELENGNDRISVKTEVGTSHMSKDESSHVVMPRRWTVDDCGVLVAVSTNESEVVIKVEKPDLTSETDTEDCDNDTISLMDASEKTVQTVTLDASATSASKVTVGDNVTVSDSVNIGDNVTIGDEMTVGDKVTVSHNENIAMRKYKCTMCGKAFPHSGMDSVHTGVTPYVCIACDKSYIEVSGVVVHRRTHSGGKPYQCNQCGKLLASTDTLRVHERQHSREKGFKCGTCGKEFRQLCGLNSHTRMHTGEKIYQCERCGKTFRRQCYLKSHEEKQNCNGPFTCFSCGKIFRYSGSLFMHTRERKCSVMAM